MKARDEETGFSLTDRELSSHVKTFLGAGHETTSMMLTWAFYLLSQHPRVVNKVRQEISEQLGNRLDFSYGELEKLTYLSMVLKEVLRLYPPASVVARRTNSETQLGDYTLPKDVRVFIIIQQCVLADNFFLDYMHNFSFRVGP
jgi:cytochrome P450